MHLYFPHRQKNTEGRVHTQQNKLNTYKYVLQYHKVTIHSLVCQQLYVVIVVKPLKPWNAFGKEGFIPFNYNYEVLLAAVHKKETLCGICNIHCHLHLTVVWVAAS